MSGTSARENLVDVRAWVADLGPVGVLDVGAGQGTYYEALKGLPNLVEIEAVEVWAPNIIRYGLQDKYSAVWQSDVRELSPLVWDMDVVIFGDVLEHLEIPEAVAVFWLALQFAKWLVISVPNSPYPQGAIDGNHHEVHLIEDPVKDLIPLLGEPDQVWRYAVTNTYIYKGAS